MKSKAMLLNLGLKMIQGLFAYLSIGIQSHSLTQLEFNNLSLIGNALILSTFLDLGVGVHFVQNYLSKFNREVHSDEDSFALKFLKQQISIFVGVSILQSIFVSLYTFFFTSHGEYDSRLKIVVGTFIVTFLFSLTGFLSRVLVARGLISELLIYQLAGILVQLIATLLSLVIEFELSYFLFTLAIPNLMVGLMSIKTLRSRSRVASQSDKKYMMDYKCDQEQFSITSNLIVQVLQVVQFATITIPLAIFVRKTDQGSAFEILILWRIFSSVASALSSFNSIEWRQNGLMKSLEESMHKEDRIYLKNKIFLGISLSVVTSFATAKAWNFLSKGAQLPSLFDWVLWILYVTVQIVQWHYYYKILPRGKYDILLFGTLIQIFVTFLGINMLEPEWVGSYPLSLLFGIVISTIYLLRMSLKIASELKDLNDKN